MENLDLVDIWRIRNPDTKRYTWRRKNPIYNVDLISFWSAQVYAQTFRKQTSCLAIKLTTLSSLLQSIYTQTQEPQAFGN